MKLGLVQTAHNALYDFLNPTFSLTREQCLALREEQFRQNLTLLESAAGQGFDLLVTAECINSIRTGPQARPEDAAVVCCTLDLTQAESPRQLRLGDRRPALYSGLTHDIPKEECNHEKSYPVD